MNRIRLEGERVILRPLSMDEFDQEWANRLEMDPSVQPIMPTRDALRARFERSGIMEGGALDLAVEVGGLMIGGIQTYDPPDRALPPGAFEIGISIDETMQRRATAPSRSGSLSDGCSRMPEPPEYTCRRSPTTRPCERSRSGSGRGRWHDPIRGAGVRLLRPHTRAVGGWPGRLIVRVC